MTLRVLGREEELTVGNLIGVLGGRVVAGEDRSLVEELIERCDVCAVAVEEEGVWSV